MCPVFKEIMPFCSLCICYHKATVDYTCSQLASEHCQEFGSSKRVLF